MIMKEMEDAKRQFEERMKALEAALKTPEQGAGSSPAKAPADTAPPPAKKSEPGSSVVKPESEKPAPAPQKPSAGEVRKPADSEPTILAKAETAKPMSVPGAEANPTPLGEMTNSLGMRFVPVGDVQFSVWPTRVSDFEAFASATGLKSTRRRSRNSAFPPGS